jgi:hypothetical protein
VNFAIVGTSLNDPSLLALPAPSKRRGGAGTKRDQVFRELKRSLVVSHNARRDLFGGIGGAIGGALGDANDVKLNQTMPIPISVRRRSNYMHSARA